MRCFVMFVNSVCILFSLHLKKAGLANRTKVHLRFLSLYSLKIERYGKLYMVSEEEKLSFQ